MVNTSLYLDPTTILYPQRLYIEVKIHHLAMFSVYETTIIFTRPDTTMSTFTHTIRWLNSVSINPTDLSLMIRTQIYLLYREHEAQFQQYAVPCQLQLHETL